jgi:hypothetical protein
MLRASSSMTISFVVATVPEYTVRNVPVGTAKGCSRNESEVSPTL